MVIANLIGWVTFGLACVGLELLAPGLFFFLSFAVGAGAAALVAWYGSPFVCQAGTFCVVVLVACFVLWAWAKLFTRQTHQYRSAVDALPGKKGTVVTSFAAHAVGQVLIDGQVWSAQSLHGKELHQGATVTVVRVEGVRLIVVLSESA